MKARSVLAVMWMLGACAGTPGETAATCATANPPDGGARYFGVLLQIERCGSDPTCKAPICWWCTDVPAGGVSWAIAGNEACVRRNDPDAG
jgi:hypothetical protein